MPPHKLSRPPLERRAQAHPFERGVGARPMLRGRLGGERGLDRQAHVLACGEPRQQRVVLEHEGRAFDDAGHRHSADRDR
jgi:hypothetical protein